MNIIQALIDSKPTQPTGEKMTEPKLLSECGTTMVVDSTEGNQYQVAIEPGDYLVVCAGATVGKASANFKHPNVAASGKVVHEFKHYHKSGRKSWSARAGMDFIFVIPRSAIKMLPEKGYSYVPAEINGVKVRFNVGGGTANGWTDWLRTTTKIGVNHKVSDLKKLADVAVRNSPMEPMVMTPLDADRETEWNRLAARASKNLVEKIAKLAEEGKRPMVKLMPGFNEKEGLSVSVIRRRKRVNLPPSPEGWKRWKNVFNAGAVKSIIICLPGTSCNIRVKVGQIDWAATAAANGVAA